MSKILVVEPYKLLQYAFATALVADHEVRIAGSLPEGVQDMDLVLIDAAAMRNRNLLGGSELEVIRNWNIPVIWLDVDLGKEVPSLKKINRATLPLDKDGLKRALSELALPPRVEPASADGPLGKGPPLSNSKPNRASDAVKQSVIDLVEVVQEDAEGKVDQSSSFKKE